MGPQPGEYFREHIRADQQKRRSFSKEKKTPEHFLKHDTISYLCLLSWSLTGAMRNFCNLSCLLLINPKVSKKKRE